MSTAEPPILLIDVDGVLSLFGFDHVAPPPGFPVLVDGTPHWLSSDTGPLLIRCALPLPPAPEIFRVVMTACS